MFSSYLEKTGVRAERVLSLHRIDGSSDIDNDERRKVEMEDSQVGLLGLIFGVNLIGGFKVPFLYVGGAVLMNTYWF